MKNVLLIGDLHCGHNVGLSHPDWHGVETPDSNTKKNKWVNIRRDLWYSFIDILKNLPPIDLLVVRWLKKDTS